jgi:hypothetical protein
MLIFDERRLRLLRARVVLLRLVVFLRAVFLREVFLLLGAARLFTIRLRVVAFLFGAAFLRVVRRLFGAAFLRVVRRLFGAAFLATFRRLTILLLGAALRRAVFFRRVVVFLLGAAFLRVVTLRRRVVGFRRVVVFLLVDFTLFTDFLLAILFIPLFFDRTLFFLLDVLRFAAGLRGFSITTSAKGMRSNLSDGEGGYKGRALLYVRVIHL